MRAQAHTARDGASWVKAGWLLFRRQPLQFSTLIMTYLLLTLAALALRQLEDPIGQILTFALVVFLPGLSVGFLEGARNAEQDRLILPPLLFRPFSSGRGRLGLLCIGAAQFIGINALFMLLELAVFGTVNPPLDHLDPENLSPADQFELVRLSAIAVAALLGVMVPLWFAPVLVSWHGLPPVKAMFFSVAAVWRNRSAFLVYLICWGMIFLFAPLAVSILMHAVGLDKVAVIALLPVIVALMGTLYCSHYAIYRSVFGGTSPVLIKDESG
jgi:hypothetical protein